MPGAKESDEIKDPDIPARVRRKRELAGDEKDFHKNL
jgi:hypothetical protein